MDLESSLAIFLLGRFEVTRGERLLRASAWTRHKAAALLQRLAVERRLLKEQAIEFLWPEHDSVTGANNLYRTLHALRQTLDRELGTGAAKEIFAFCDGMLTLADNVWVDVAAFESLAGSHDQANLMQALHLYTGDFLPDERYAEWTLASRTSLSRLQREVRLRLATRAQETQMYYEAISLLIPLLTDDQADEVVHRELMTLYALAGRRHEALRQYQACVEALAAELDVPPDLQTDALYARIISGDLVPPPTPIQPALNTPMPIVPEREIEIPLIGRQSDLETILSRLQPASQGEGRVLLLAGESGVGKTRLALEVLRTLRSTGTTVLFCTAYEQEGQLPYQPFIEAFDRYLAEHQLPLEHHPITHFKRLGVSDPQREQWALFNAAVMFLLGLAARHPVVLLVDDLHAADATSLQLFHHVARQTRTASVMLLATYRTDIAPQTAPLGTLLNALYRAHLSETLHLAPLMKGEVASMITALLGRSASLPLLESMFAITEGNPFFVQEITRLLLKSNQVEEGKGQWQLKLGVELAVPTGLSGLLRERISRLGAPVETTLKAAAVVGQEFRFDVLRRLVTLSEGKLLDTLEAALDSHMLEETADGYCFHHPLTRHVLYETLSRERRMLLHLRTAEAIEAAYTSRPQGLFSSVEGLAFHYERSSCRDRALPYLLQAGRRAADLYAFEVAVSYFERALALMDEFGLDDPTGRWEILQALGRWGFILGETPRAIAHIEQALTSLQGHIWRPGGRIKARLHRIAAIMLLNAGNMADAESHLQAALASIQEQEDAEEYAHAYYSFAVFYWHQSEFQLALEAAQKSLVIAERIGDPLSLARAYEMLALTYHSLGEWQRGLDFEQQRSLAIGTELDVTELFDVHLCLWEYHLYGDHDYDEVKQSITATLIQAQRMGAVRAVALCRCIDGTLEFQSGHWTNAEASLRAAIQSYQQIGAAFGQSLSCQQLGELLTAKGKVEEGLAILLEGLAVADRAMLRAHCLTRLNASLVRNRLAAGDLVAADQALAQGVAMSERHSNCSTCSALLLPAAISLRIAQGDLTEAAHFCQQLNQVAAKYASQLWLAMAQQAYGELATVQGELENALNAYTGAMKGFRLSGNEYEAARCLSALASIHLARNAVREAEGAREEAQQIFERLTVS